MDILSWIMNNVLYIGIGLGNLVVAGLIFWWFKRRGGDEFDGEDPEITALLAGQVPKSISDKEEENEGEDEEENESVWTCTCRYTHTHTHTHTHT